MPQEKDVRSGASVLSERIDGLVHSASDPEHLTSYITDLEAIGFTATFREQLVWVGPTPRCLVVDGHTTATQCTITFRAGWPYLPPLLEVEGIETWHANQQRLCLWREGDASRQWATVAGFLERVDSWSEAARSGFDDDPETLNTLVYWNGPPARRVGLIDIPELGDRSQRGVGDGHSGRLHFRPGYTDADGVDLVLRLTPNTLQKQDIPGEFGNPKELRGRYFYRGPGVVDAPPTTLEEWEAVLTEEQSEQYRRDTQNRSYQRLVHVLLWETGGGPAGLALEATRGPGGGWVTSAMDLRPDGEQALLLRAGPDAPILRDKLIVLIGIGAIGGYIADLLARSGAGHLRLVDPDVLWPANATRYVVGQGVIGPKVQIIASLLMASYPWVDVAIHADAPWTPQSLTEIVDGADLVVNATADLGHIELTSRVCEELGVASLAASLHRGGDVVRVTRHADGDTPIWQRTHLDRYPDIPPLPDELEYAGLETGCLAPVHNAPPTAVVRAAALATDVAIDYLTGRRIEHDEVIEVLQSSGDWLDQVGRVDASARPMNAMLTEFARSAMLDATESAGSHETGGLLAGPLDGDRPVISHAVEIPSAAPSPTSFLPPIEDITAALDELQATDEMIGYHGLWHSHPGVAEPSTTDLASFTAISNDPDTGSPVFIIIAGGEEGPTLTAHRHPDHGPVYLHRSGDLEVPL